MELVSVKQSEVSQKEKNKYHVLMHACGIYKNGTDKPICRAGIEMQMCGHGAGGRGDELGDWE